MTPAPRRAAAEALMDGRHRRAEASREKIVKAMMDLVAGGDVSPSAEAVAARAGVAPRSVFRHFANMDALYQEMNALVTAEIQPMASPPLAATTLDEVVEELAERRAAIFERIMPFKICGEVHRHRSPYLAEQHDHFLREQREGVRRALPAAHRENRALLEALDLLFSFETWRRLRLDQKLPRPRAKALVVQLATLAAREASKADGR